jgi:uncharacterized RDD family membrane protein YckC
MIDGHGVVKVLDFGLAAGAPEASTGGPVAQTSLAGTPLYMAPEQARGEPIDFRADVYALGATLYHLASGRPPFQADSVDALVTLHASAARPTLPRRGQPRSQIGAIDQLCATMMAPRPEDRFASYDELIHAIELASAVHTRPAGFWARSIALLVDIIVMGVAFALWRGLSSLVGIPEPYDAIPFPLFALYQALAIRRWGTTLGKALYELEVVAVATSRRPSRGQAVRRELVLVVPAWLALEIPSLFSLVGVALPRDVAGLGCALMVASAIGLLLSASVRVAGKRALWDRLSGTMVRYRTTRATAR